MPRNAAAPIARTPRPASWLLALCALAAAHLAPAPALAQPRLQSFQSHHYVIHTNLRKKEVVDLGRHMDRVFAEYERRFAGFRSRRAGQMPLYLFRTRDDYTTYMRQQGLDASNSGGMFFVTPSAQGLATWTHGRSHSETVEVLQHEGFHQFAFNYLGADLPVWCNEGLAQYFEDAILVDTSMRLGFANARRLALVQNAIERKTAISVEELVGISHNAWGATLNSNAERAALLYAQSWSLAFFLIHGDGGRYQKAFVAYLAMISDGHDSTRSFRKAFGTDDLSAVERRWVAFVREQEPDEVNAAREKLEFLGAALAYLAEEGDPLPKSLPELREHLQARQFRLTRQTHGLATEYAAADPLMFQFKQPSGSVATFEFRPPTRDDLPPRITAPGLKPQPTLVWSRNEEGTLVQDIEYR